MLDQVLKYGIYAMIPLLLIGSGTNDAVASTAAVLGSRTLSSRVVFIATLLSSMVGWWLVLSDGLRGRDYWFDNFFLHNTDPSQRLVMGTTSTLSAVAAALLSFFMNYPTPLGPIILVSISGFFLTANDNAENPLWQEIRKHGKIGGIVQAALLAYVLLPLLASWTAWAVYRLLIRWTLYGETEGQFRRTMSWTVVLYPVCIAVAAAAMLLRILAVRIDEHMLAVTFALGGAVCIAGLGYCLFRFFLRAGLKRHVFLKYPQEHAHYLERSERAEQGDREARGLGPTHDHYSASQSASHSASQSVSRSLEKLPAGESLAVAAGKTALNAKRSEQLFRPALIILALATETSCAFIETTTLIQLLKKLLYYHDNSYPMLLYVAIIPLAMGRVLLSRGAVIFTSRNILPSMTPSQGFAIQFGVLVAMTLAFTLRISSHMSPLMCLVAAIIAVGAGSMGNAPDAPNSMVASSKRIMELISPSQSRQDYAAFRLTAAKLLGFWLICALNAFIIGAVAGLIANKVN